MRKSVAAKLISGGLFTTGISANFIKSDAIVPEKFMICLPQHQIFLNQRYLIE